MAVEPQFHGLPRAPADRDCNRLRVILRDELATIFDVTAEAVHEIEPVPGHLHTPRHASRILSLNSSGRDTLPFQSGAPQELNSFTWVKAGNPASEQFTLSDQRDNQDIAHLKKVNADLSRSLERCRELVERCRAKLAANSNEPFMFGNDDDEEESDLA